MFHCDGFISLQSYLSAASFQRVRRMDLTYFPTACPTPHPTITIFPPPEVSAYTPRGSHFPRSLTHP